MNVGLYQSASSLTALERWQDVVTQNITSSQVRGYKRRTVEFQGALPQQFSNEAARSTEGASARSIFPFTTFAVDHSHGENLVTKGALDLAIQGEGYFALQTEEGDTLYSRSGQFRVTPDRRIVNSQGHEVLDSDGNPLQLLPAAGGEIIVDQDGTLLQGGVPLGRLGVHGFDDPNVLRPLAGSVFVAPFGVEPELIENPVIVQGSIEGSNVKPLREMVDLVNIARAYEANQKIIQTSDEIMKRTLESLG